MRSLLATNIFFLSLWCTLLRISLLTRFESLIGVSFLNKTIMCMKIGLNVHHFPVPFSILSAWVIEIKWLICMKIGLTSIKFHSLLHVGINLMFFCRLIIEKENLYKTIRKLMHILLNFHAQNNFNLSTSANHRTIKP